MLVRPVLLSFFFSLPLFGQAHNSVVTPHARHVSRPPKVALVVECECRDIVGARYATALRDSIASSPRYLLASREDLKDSSPSNYAQLVVHIVTMDSESPDQGLETIIGWVLTSDDTMLDHSIQTCGREKVVSCSNTTLASVDEYVELLYSHT